MALRLLLLGPPGAGKGTQAARLAGRAGVAHVATGDMFRQAVREGTLLGREAQAYMERGDLVPDEVTIGIVRERLAKPDAAGFVLDGFPRTAPQAQALEGILAALGRPLQAVVNLAVSDDEVVRRLGGRRVCESCGHTYHVEFDPPAREGMCDRCGGRLVRRADDEDATIRRRLQVYREQTAPLVAFYEERGLLRQVDGTGSPDSVTGAILSAVGASPLEGHP